MSRAHGSLILATSGWQAHRRLPRVNESGTGNSVREYQDFGTAVGHDHFGSPAFSLAGSSAGQPLPRRRRRRRPPLSTERRLHAD
jgi:hypothetical protein